MAMKWRAMQLVVEEQEIREMKMTNAPILHPGTNNCSRVTLFPDYCIIRLV